MQTLEIVVVVIIVALLARGFKYLKAIPIKPQTAFILAIIVAGVGAYNWNWGGAKDYLAGVEIAAPEEPAVTPGATYEAEGSESEENMTYDAGSRVFTCWYYENVGAEEAQYNPTGETDDEAIGSVEVTLTVYRTDSLVLVENATSKVWAVVPTFYGTAENASIAYAPIDKDTGTQKYEVAFAPAGVTARDEYNYFSVGSGGSRNITVTADLYNIGLCQLDNFDSTDVKIYLSGVDGYFTLRFTKIGETT